MTAFRKSDGAIDSNQAFFLRQLWHMACSIRPGSARGVRYSGREAPMKLHVVAVVACAATVVASPSFADAKSEAKSQVEFGINVAQRGLWREAIYRWEKAVELDPTYAAAWNDLGIAYEQQGKFEEANKSYNKAIQLDPNNQLIRQNYDLFREIYDRTKRRRDR